MPLPRGVSRYGRYDGGPDPLAAPVDLADARAYELARMRHSAAHLMAEAVQEIFPDARFGIGPAIQDGFYYGFVPDTVRAFEDAGARYYNEAIYVGAIGSLPVRVGRQFEGGRKLGKTHQNVLVFCKGDWRRATAACGQIEVSWPQAEEAT